MADESPHNLPTRRDPPEPVKAVLDAMSDQDRVLILCNYGLYGGDWGLLRKDLLDRLTGRPYVLKVGERIREDLERVDRFEVIEKECGISLADYVTI